MLSLSQRAGTGICLMMHEYVYFRKVQLVHQGVTVKGFQYVGWYWVNVAYP
jgi:hypothetical protein